MPDTEALKMVDAVAKVGPALSATSDMPKFSGVGDPTPESVPEQKPEDKPEQDPTGGEPKPGAEDAGKTEPTGDDTGQDETPEAATAEDLTPPGVKRAITREKNRRREAEARAAAAEARLDAFIRERTETLSKSTAKPVSDDPRPKRETFDNPDAYETALIEWSAKQASSKAEQTVKQQIEEETRTKQFNDTKAKWAERVNKFSEDHEDFREIAYADTPIFTETPYGWAMTSVVMQLENGPEIVYHLGKHPEVADRIARLPAALAVVELGKVSASLAAPKPEVSKAPPPIKPVGSRANASRKTPEDMSMDEYASMRQSQRRQEWRERHGMVNGQTS